uniref:Ovule protein n=1 Tax=Panagrellus redivivus TaxID=6233 RepID=A0A7E4V6N3_PANRE
MFVNDASKRIRAGSWTEKVAAHLILARFPASMMANKSSLHVLEELALRSINSRTIAHLPSVVADHCNPLSVLFLLAKLFFNIS